MRTLAVLLLLTATASAEPSSDAPPTQQVSETTATLLSAGGALAGIATIYMGANMHGGGDTPIMELGGAIALVGPSLGNWYGRQTAYFTPGLGIRLGGVALMGLGFGSALDRNCSSSSCTAPIHDTYSDSTIGIGAAIAVVGMIYDIATAGHEAYKTNTRGLTLDPMVLRTPSHGVATGVGLSGSF